jgi:hypothetical protein
MSMGELDYEELNPIGHELNGHLWREPPAVAGGT